jgi:putative redox protein
MNIKASARRMGDTLQHVVDVNGRHAIVTDEPLSAGGEDAGPAPHELLPATLAACISTMVAMYARRRGWDVGELTVDVDYDPQAVPRRFEIRLHLPGGLSPEQVARLRRVAHTCPVRRAFETGFVFDEQVVAAPAARRSHAA